MDINQTYICNDSDIIRDGNMFRFSGFSGLRFVIHNDELYVMYTDRNKHTIGARGGKKFVAVPANTFLKTVVEAVKSFDID